jgi:hypothetical protein
MVESGRKWEKKGVYVAFFLGGGKNKKTGQHKRIDGNVFR